MIVILILIVCAVLSYILYRRVEKKTFVRARMHPRLYYYSMHYCYLYLYSLVFNNVESVD